MKITKSKLRLVGGFALILILVCALMMSGMFAKYRTEMMFANDVKYTNTLAESFKLLDHPMTQLEDGSYKVDDTVDAQPTDGYTFKLIPGITIPANPYVEIKGKTEIPAYLYLELDSSAGVDLDLGGDWTRLDGVSGKKGGEVYAYHDGSALTGSGGEDVLTVPAFTVEPLSKYPADLSEGEIKLYAYLLQKVGEKSTAETYSAAPAP